MILGEGLSVAKEEIVYKNGPLWMGVRLLWSHLSLVFPDAAQVTPGSLEELQACFLNRIFLLGEDRVGDTPEHHPQDPARAWVSPCVSLRARTRCCLCAGRAGWAAVPRIWGWPQSVGSCEPRNTCARCGRQGWHKWEPCRRTASAASTLMCVLTQTPWKSLWFN